MCEYDVLLDTVGWFGKAGLTNGIITSKRAILIDIRKKELIRSLHT